MRRRRAACGVGGGVQCGVCAVRACFVPGRAAAARWAAGGVPAAVREARRGADVVVSRRARALAAEPLFARDDDLTSLPDIVLQCIMQVLARCGARQLRQWRRGRVQCACLVQCPIDARRALAGAVLVTGGGAALPGLRARLAEELRHLAAQPPYK